MLTTIVSLDTIDAYFDIDEKSFLRYGRTAKDGNENAAFQSGGEVGIALPGDKSPSFAGELNFAENRLDTSTGIAGPHSKFGPCAEAGPVRARVANR